MNVRVCDLVTVLKFVTQEGLGGFFVCLWGFLALVLRMLRFLVMSLIHFFKNCKGGEERNKCNILLPYKATKTLKNCINKD